MFSCKEISSESRCFGLIRNKKTKEVETQLYFTELSRDLEYDPEDFKEDIIKFASIDSNNEFKTKSNYEFEMACHTKTTTTFQRFMKLYIAPSNSGKSYNLAKLCQKYNNVFPDKNMIYGSVNSLENDKSFKDIKDKIKELDVLKTDKMIDVFAEELKGSLIIFDDLDSNCGNLTAEYLDPSYTPDYLAELSLNEKTKINKMLAAKIKCIEASIIQSVKHIIFNGRKQKISMAYVFHALNNGRFENELLNEVSSVVLFPYATNGSVLRKWLIAKLHFDNISADYIVKKTWYQYDFCEINTLGGKKFMMTPDLLKLFEI